MRGNHQESGQALVLGLSIFALSALGAIYLLQKMRVEHSRALGRTKNWVEAMRTCQDAAHTLNSIALHNRYILKSLAKAANTWDEAAEWSLAFANAQPFWQKVEPSTEPRFIFEKFTTLAKQGFTMAAANAYAAKEMAQNLMQQEPRLQGALSQTSNTEAFCWAAEKHFQNSGIYSTSHSNCSINIFSGHIVRFSSAIQEAAQNSLGIIIISDIQKMNSWMQSCRDTNDEDLSIVLRNKRFETALTATNQKQNDVFWEAMLFPAWTASLRVRGLVQNDFSH